MSPPDSFDVLIDIDGVIYPFPELFTPFASRQLGRELELDTTDWAFYERWGLDGDTFVEMLRHGVLSRALWWEGDPYDEARAAIARLRDGGHRLHLVTARGVIGEAVARAATVSWLEHVGIAVDSVNLAEDKPTVLGALGLDPARCIAVDDAPQHVAAWELAGVSAVVLDRWGTYAGAHDAVTDLDQFADVVASLTSGACR